MNTCTDLSDYEQWLADEGYQPSTIVVSLRHLRGVEDNPDDVGEYRVPHLRRYLRYVQQTRKNPLGRKFTTTLKKVYGLEPSKEIEKRGQSTKKCLSQEQWSRLRKELATGDTTQKLLLAYMESPLRISEFLSLTLHDLPNEACRNAKARVWMRRQQRIGATRVYHILCPTKRCAYARLRRSLREVCEELRMTTDLDTLYKSFHALAEAAAA